MAGGRDRARWDHTGRRVLLVHQDFQRRALGELRRRGHTSLTPSLIALLPHLEQSGSRVSDVAERAGITKQAVSKLVQELVRLGYVARAPDRDDGRAQVVTFTPTGDTLLADIRRTIRIIERAYAGAIGDGGLVQLHALLDRVLGDDPRPGAPSRPTRGT